MMETPRNLGTWCLFVSAFSPQLIAFPKSFSRHPFRSRLCLRCIRARCRDSFPHSLHTIKFYFKQTTSSTGGDVPSVDESLPEASVSHVQQHGGLAVFLYRISRLLACLALIGISIFSLFQNGHSQHRLSHSLVLHLALCGVYVYSTFLALLSVVCRPSIAKPAITHLCVVLLVVLAVFFYRDLWPLCTTTLHPIDNGDGIALWIHIGVLTFAAAVVPLVVPRPYLPQDINNPSPIPNPEQTASILSLMLYTFLDKTIFMAYNIPHLPLDKLPPLADYDSAKHLVARSFPFLDPFTVAKRRHLFFGFMSLFRVEYCILGLMLILRVITTFASPIGINRLLYYLENGGEGMTVRPFVWIVWLFLGPILGAIAVQWYIFIATRMMVRTQAIVTQLVFDHALRIRVKAETSDTPPSSARTSTVTTPDTASIADHASTPGGSTDGTSDDETSAAVSTQGAVAVKKANQRDSQLSTSSTSTKVAEKSGDSKGGNLVGKMTNLVTTDTQNIIEGRDFLFAGKYPHCGAIVIQVLISFRSFVHSLSR
ncbi:hypothetical protein QCA50_001429 [Cerrena zonata]|uniref:Uncharacterized protein n=1 Tax=Cerrena zonata TaxID=2478898 RepID=A0AAW0GTA4_9APHY